MIMLIGRVCGYVAAALGGAVVGHQVVKAIHNKQESEKTAEKKPLKEAVIKADPA